MSFREGLMEALDVVGEWAQQRNNPNRFGFWTAVNPPRQWVDRLWDPSHRDLVLKHLRASKRFDAQYGYHKCLICGENYGCHDVTDGTWTWPESLEHYVEKHDVRPTGSFVEHVLASKEKP